MLVTRPGAFSRLSKGDTVIGIAVALGQAVDLGGHAADDLETGSIVLGGVDAQT